MTFFQMLHSHSDDQIKSECEAGVAPFPTRRLDLAIQQLILITLKKYGYTAKNRDIHPVLAVQTFVDALRFTMN